MFVISVVFNFVISYNFFASHIILAAPDKGAGFIASVEVFSSVDSFKETTARNQKNDGLKSNNHSENTIAGITGGGPPEHIIESGKLWPATFEGQAGFNSSIQNPQLVDRFQDETAVPNRPSFAGINGGGVPHQIIKPGKPWPARPEDYAGFNSSTQNPQLVDRFQDETAKNQEDSTSGSNIPNTVTILPVPNRPSFAGVTGGSVSHQIIKSRKPWPARPEDYVGFSSFAQKPQLVYKFQDTTAENQEDYTSASNIPSTITLLPLLNRPSFAESSGGSSPQARPEDPPSVDEFLDTTAQNLEDSTTTIT